MKQIVQNIQQIINVKVSDKTFSETINCGNVMKATPNSGKNISENTLLQFNNRPENISNYKLNGIWNKDIVPDPELEVKWVKQ